MLDIIHLIIIGAGVLQLPLIMDVIQHLFPSSPLGRAVTRVMRYLLMLCLVFSVSAAVYVHLTVLLREHVNDYANILPADAADDALWLLRPRALIHAVFSLWVYVLLLSNFWAACMLPPSRVQKPAAAASTSTSAGGVLLVAPMHSGAQLDQAEDRMCKQCRVPKLLRTHHCRICNTCVELMDHHCPFTGSCVGLSTFRPFYLWVAYGFLGISYATYISLHSFALCWYDSLGSASMSTEEGEAAHAQWESAHGAVCARLGRASFVFLPAFFGWLSTLFIFAMQSLLLHWDVTTIEYLKNITELQWRMHAPVEVDSDRKRREQRGEQKKTRRRKEAGASSSSSSSNDATYDYDDTDSMEGEGGVVGVDVYAGMAAVDAMESGSPLSGSVADGPTDGSYATHYPAVAVGAAAAYNPHKSFRLLIFQRQPLWTLLVPPMALVDLLRRKQTAQR